ncbi:MAG: hypothetical protein AAF688_08140 [Bacteroidota bacterium]
MRFGVLLMLIGVSSVSIAQTRETDFGIKGGLNFSFFRADEGDFGENATAETGFYGGVFVDFHIDDFLSIQPEALYIGLGEFKFINAPIYCKYNVAENINLMVGPSMNYFFDLFNRRFKVRGDVCASYNMSPTFDLHIKYTLGFQILTPDVLFVGLGCRF